MNEDPTSLSRLHDLAVPPEVPWWPLAPGWYVVILLIALFSFWSLWHLWRNWRSNAYRRAALRELADARDIATIAEILRRTALAIAPRESIAGKTGNDWLDWLGEHSPVPLPGNIRDHLTVGIYGRRKEPIDLNALRSFATNFINRHQNSKTVS